ncbi:interleukin-10 receptor subunit beta [Engraulis encrasicolus]|uniref:interleukin-10 receptor subunit beta n=1 Tax=Engraulis encrasicolus TaxID=184585 RepID=UPI002FCF6892
MKTAAVLVCLAIVLDIQPCHGTIEDFPVPEHVRLETLNTHYVLKWDWNTHTPHHNVTFTAQYLAKYKLRRRRLDWVSVCEGVDERECDFTAAKLTYLGIFLLRVRANTHTHAHTHGEEHTLHSDWVNITFCPDIDAVLGPPSSVDITSEGRGLLELRILDPVTHDNQSMGTLIEHMYYRIQYWIPRTHPEVQELNSSVSLVTLSSLVEGEVYCARVQTRYDYYNKASTYTSPQCLKVTGVTPYWQVALWFLLALLLVSGVVMLFFYTSVRVLKITRPSNKLPTHMHQYFQSPACDRPRLLTPESESCLLIGQMDVELLPASPPPCCPGDDHRTQTHHCCHDNNNADSSDCSDQSRHSYADSDEGSNHSRHGSGDSGMYSAEEASGGGRRGVGDRGGEEEEEKRGEEESGEEEEEEEKKKRGEQDSGEEESVEECRGQEKRSGKGDRVDQEKRSGEEEPERERENGRKHEETEEDEGVRDVCV